MRGLRDSNGYRDPAPRVGDRNPTARELRGEGDERDEDILYEARERFRRVSDWEAEFRQAFADDVKFAHGDGDNHWQWPDTMYGERGDRPSLTINKTRQHCLQIINDAKQNKPQVRITPVSDEATKASADVFEGIVRHIEYVSNAASAYDTATTSQVQGGIGWWRVVTEYEDEARFELGCRIKRVQDALSVYLDPDIQEADGSDAGWGFVIDDVPRDVFELKYPEYRNRVPQGGTAGPVIAGGWLDEDHVRVAEYFRKVAIEDTLHLLPDGSTVREGDLGTPEMLQNVKVLSRRARAITVEQIEWYKLVGGEIVDRAIEPGKYIGLVRVIGEEQIIEGRLERKGHVRALKDPQRMYNYWSSSAVEAVALQSKAPYIAAAESIEAYQGYWDTANTQNYSVLPFNARDDQGQPLPPPQRQTPPQMGQAYIAGMQVAQQELMMASGQYQPMMGQPSPNTEISGKAISARQRQGDNATYHFIDNLAVAIRFTGRILLDLIPKIYDTPRVLRILAVDGTVDRVQLDPRANQALQTRPNPEAQANGGAIMPPSPQQAMAQKVVRIFNPAVGSYEVRADIGPAYATRRQQAFDAMTQIIATAPAALNFAGDLLFKAADFPLAEELADRFQRMVPPQALGQGPSQVETLMQQQLAGSQAHVALLSEKLAVAEMKLKLGDHRSEVDAYKAVTDRMGTLLSNKSTDGAYNDGTEVRGLIYSMVRDAMSQLGMAPVSRMAWSDAQQQDAVIAGLRGEAPLGAPPVPGGALPPDGLPGMASGQIAGLSPIGAPQLNPQTPPLPDGIV